MSKKNHTITLRLDNDLNDRLSKIASNQSMSKSDLLRRIASDYIDRRDAKSDAIDQYRDDRSEIESSFRRLIARSNGKLYYSVHDQYYSDDGLVKTQCVKLYLIVDGDIMRIDRLINQIDQKRRASRSRQIFDINKEKWVSNKIGAYWDKSLQCVKISLRSKFGDHAHYIANKLESLIGIKITHCVEL